MIMSDIEAGATKTKHAVADVTEDAVGEAKEQGHRIERIARMILRVMPLLPERTFSFLLDRAGLARKSSPMTSALVFAGGFASGFVAGGATAALTTPLSGPQLRTKLGEMLHGGVEKVEQTAEKVRHPGDTLDEDKGVGQEQSLSDAGPEKRTNADRTVGNGGV